MKRYVIEEIGTASSDEEDIVRSKTTTVKEAKTNSENKTATEAENSLTAISSEEKTTVPRQDAETNSAATPTPTPTPTQTVAGNTESLKTEADQNRPNKPTPEAPPIPDSSKASTHATLNVDLTPPVSSIQFETTWKRLGKYPDLLYKYMKVQYHLPLFSKLSLFEM